MRCILLALVLAVPLAAQPSIDVSAAYGGAVTASGELPISDGTALASVSVAAAPGLPYGIRLVASAAYGPGNDRGDGRTLALSVGGELPFSGGSRGVYLALGAALLDFDNGDVEACNNDPECFNETAPVGSHTGLAATVGLGARIPVTRRLYVEPAVSAFVWDEVLPSGRIGVGWRLR